MGTRALRRQRSQLPRSAGMGLGRWSSRAHLELAAAFEELPQQTRGFFAAHATEYVQAMRKPRLPRQIDDATPGPSLGAPRPEYQPRHARIERRSHAHDTGFQRRIQRG